MTSPVLRMAWSIIPKKRFCLLAHPDRHLLPKAVEAVTVEYEPLPAIFSIEDSESRAQTIWGADNIFKSYLIEKGDVDSIWQNAAHIVERRIHYRRARQLYIENNGMIAQFDVAKGITVWGSLQCPFYIHKALMKLLDLPADRVRVVQMEPAEPLAAKKNIRR